MTDNNSNGTNKTQETVTLDDLKDLELKTPVLEFGADESAAPEQVKDGTSEKAEEEEINSLTTQGSALNLAKIAEDAELTEAEKAQISDFVQKIDVTDVNAVINYGAGAQKKISDFSDKALMNVKTNDMGETGKMITNLVTELKNFDVDDEKGGFFSFFKKKKNDITALKAKYSKVESNVTDIQNQLEDRQRTLMKDSAMLDRMYDINKTYFKELSMYIIAGKQKLEEVRSGELAALTSKAEQSGLPEDAQAAKDLAEQCNRFEKKLYDLELTRQITLQTGPQIRMIQASDALMAEKIQSTIVNTIPLWKNQMVIAMGLEHSVQAAKAEQAVSDMTNELLKKNSEALHQATVESVKASERGIVDVETLKKTNQDLIQTLDDVVKIQTEGHQKRVAAEQELTRIEGELRTKLLSAANSIKEQTPADTPAGQNENV
jgi:uncharacterized protein YaaN involved in tellurite resistance